MKSWFARWLPGGRGTRAGVGISYEADRIGVVVLDPAGGTVQAAGGHAGSEEEQARFLAAFVDEHGLSGSPATVILSAQDYDIQQLELAGVPDEDLAGAARFRLRDVSRTPVEQIRVCARRLAASHRGASEDMVFTAFMDGERVDAIAERVEASGLVPHAIIPREFALTRLAARLPENESGIAALSLEADGGTLTIGRGGDLYLPRAMRQGIRQMAEQGALGAESLALELQRSLDYYETQLAGAPASQLFLLPGEFDLDELQDQLRQSLLTPIRVFDGSLFLEDASALDALGPDARGPVALALGGALPGGLPPGSSFHQPSERRFEMASAAGLSLCVGGTALVLALATGAHAWVVAGVEAEQRAVESELAEQEDRVAELEDRAADHVPDPELRQRRDRLESDLAGQRRLEEELVELDQRELEGFSRVLRALWDHRTEGVWLTRFRVDGSRLRFEGGAVSAERVPAFLDGLAHEAVFQGVRFGDFRVSRVQPSDDGEEADERRAPFYRFRVAHDVGASGEEG